MDTRSISAFQDLVHNASLVAIGVVFIIAVISIVKPQFFQKFMYEFGERKYVLSTCVFIGLLCSTVFIATESSGDNAYVSENTKHTVSSVDLLQQPQTGQPQPIEIKEIETVESIPYPVEQRDDPALKAGQIQLVQAGKNGIRTLIFTVTYANGEETSRTLKSEKVTVEPIPEITAIGTQEAAGHNQSAPAKPEKSQSSRGFLPSVKLACKKDSHNSSRPQICLYKN